MRRFYSSALASAILLLGGTSAKADWDSWGLKYESEIINGEVRSFYNLYTINSHTGEETLRQRFCRNVAGCASDTSLPYLYGNTDILSNENHIDKDSFIIRERDTNDGVIDTSQIIYKKYTLNGDTLSSQLVTEPSEKWFEDYKYIAIRGATSMDGDGNLYSDIGGKMWVKETSDGTISWGKAGSSTALYSLDENGVSHKGTNLLSRTSDGITSIGANSLKLQEQGGKQKMWATDASGKSIPIDINNGTKLLINGRDVEQSINNVGALSAALTGLPTVPTETTLACGLGTGTHGGDLAFSGGCASKVNEKLSINYAASMTMPGQDYAGDFEDQLSARAGFIWKLGKSVKPTLISMNEKKGMQAKITELSTSNTKIHNQNKKLQAKVDSFQFANQEMKASNQELRNLLAIQNERLEKIEQIALANKKNEKTAFSFLNVSNLFSSMRSFLISSN